MYLRKLKPIKIIELSDKTAEEKPNSKKATQNLYEMSMITIIILCSLLGVHSLPTDTASDDHAATDTLKESDAHLIKRNAPTCPNSE